LAALLVALPACGGSADPKALTDAGRAALGSGEYAQAADEFAAALAAIGGDTRNPHFARAKMGHVEASLRKDPGAARDEFLAYAKANPSTVTPDDFSQIGRAFTSASKYSEAIDIVDAGLKMHVESAVLAKLVEDIKKAAERDGDSAAIGKLAGLGYL
jgi:hypothetical protein